MAKKAFENLTESMFYVLMAFLHRELCGTEIAAFVAEKTAQRIQLGPGTLYTILSRFEAEELIVEIAVEGRKRTYRITPKGKELFFSELKRLQSCVADALEEVSL